MRCVTKRQGEKIMREVHGGDCGEDQSQGRLKGKIIHLGYYWPRLSKDCINYVKRCRVCQLHSNLDRLPKIPQRRGLCDLALRDVLGRTTTQFLLRGQYVRHGRATHNKAWRGFATRDVLIYSICWPLSCIKICSFPPFTLQSQSE